MIRRAFAVQHHPRADQEGGHDRGEVQIGELKVSHVFRDGEIKLHHKRTCLASAVVGLNRAAELDRERITFAINLIAHRDLDPIFANAILFYVVTLIAFEANADFVIEYFFDMEFAARISGKPIRQSGFAVGASGGF